MNFNIEISEDTLLINRTDLKETLREMLVGASGESIKEEMMTIQETAAYLKVSVPTVRAMIAKKEIPFFQRGQVIRLNRYDVKNWIRGNYLNNKQVVNKND